TCVTVCMHPSGDVKLETVGPPMPGVEVRIADSGEVLVRSPGLMKEYYKRPDATREAIDPEGFFHTGDAGYFDAGGHLKIIDRARDSTLANSQIRRFLVLHKELEADDGELTRTRKVRRRHIGDKYAVLVDALYSDKTSCFVETQMRFEDGRTGTVSADLQIVE